MVEMPEELFEELAGLRNTIIRRSDFTYNLDPTRIARYPLEERDRARLMVVHRETGTFEHRIFKDLVDYLEPGDVVVVNNAKVFPARLKGIKENTGAQIEVLLVRELNPELHLWEVLVRPARKVRIGNRLRFTLPDGRPLYAEVVDNTVSKGRTIRFIFSGSSQELRDILRQIGHMPIPPYLKREDEPLDREYYQTIFAKDEEEFAIASSTAALHFSETLVKRLLLKDVQVVEITLHMGLPSFLPIQVEDLRKHVMEAEFVKIPEASARAINEALRLRKRVIAVGTSVVRALEGSVNYEGYVMPGNRWVNLFIYPPFEFRIVQGLVTNFHAPESSNLILVCAFGGRDLILKAYEVAQQEGYRFLTYGDAMLIL